MAAYTRGMAGTNSRRAPRDTKPARGARAAATPDNRRTISWRHCLIGIVAGEAALLLISNVALGITNAAFGSSGLNNADGGIVGVSTLLAVLLGSFIAARLAGRFELYQGVVVGIGFIVVGALYQFLAEAQVVHSALATGSHYLVDLGPMSMGGLISGDLLALFAGSVGGLLSHRFGGDGSPSRLT